MRKVKNRDGDVVFASDDTLVDEPSSQQTLPPENSGPNTLLRSLSVVIDHPAKSGICNKVLAKGSSNSLVYNLLLKNFIVSPKTSRNERNEETRNAQLQLAEEDSRAEQVLRRLVHLFTQ